MAEVQFLGFGNTGFPDNDVQILPANPAQTRDVQFQGFGATAIGELSTQVQTYSPTLTGAPEFTEVNFVDMRKPVHRQLSPNVNDIVMMVVGGPTSGGQFINVRVVGAPFELNGDETPDPLPKTDLRLFKGPLAPSGLVGKIALFGVPTGLTLGTSAIRGMTGLIQIIDLAHAPGTPTTTFNVNTALIGFNEALPIQPTIGDRLIVPSTDVTLRRTPLLEIFLSQDEG